MALRKRRDMVLQGLVFPEFCLRVLRRLGAKGFG